MFDIFGRKRIREMESMSRHDHKALINSAEKLSKIQAEYAAQGVELVLKNVEIQGYKDRIMKLEKMLNFVTVNKPAKRRNDVLLASLACGKSTVTPVMEYLKRKGIKDPDGGDYKRSTVQDILKPPATK